MSIFKNILLFFTGIFSSIIPSTSTPLKPTATITAAPVEYRLNQAAYKINNFTLKNIVGQMDGKVNFSLSDDGVFVKSLSGNNSSLPVNKSASDDLTPESTARRFLDKYQSLFGISAQEHELELYKIDASGTQQSTVYDNNRSISFGSFDPNSLIYVKFTQNYNNIPVYGKMLIVHVTPFGDVAFVKNNLLPDSYMASLNLTPALDPEMAKEVLKNQLLSKNPSAIIKISSTDLNIVNLADFKNSPPKAMLSYLIHAQGQIDNRHSDVIYIVDANKGEIISYINNIRTLNRKIYDCIDDRCQDYWPHNPAISEGRTTQNTEANNFYVNIRIAHNFFSNILKRDGVNNKGGYGTGKKMLITNLNYRYEDDLLGYHINKENSLGFLTNSPNITGFVDPYFGLIGLNYDFNTLDVIAHEYSHLIQDLYDGPNGNYQSGALDEGFADIFAKMISTKNWQVSSKNELIRDLSNPSVNNDPDRLFSTNYVCSHPDGHSNSTVISHSAYLLSEGGDFNGCQIQGIGRKKTVPIFLMSSVICLNPTSNFKDAYDCLVNSCANIYGEDSTECDSTTDALQSVELDQQWSDSQFSPVCFGNTALPPACAENSPIVESTNTPTPTPNIPSSTPTRIQPTNTPTPTLIPGAPTLTPTTAPSPTPTLKPGAPTPTITSANVQPTPTITPSPTNQPSASCHPVYLSSVTDLNGNNLNYKIPKDRDFLCKVTTDKVNYTSICALQFENEIPMDVCRKFETYGYKYWSGNNAVFKCNTKCAQSANCSQNFTPKEGAYKVIGYDFSPSCGPDKENVFKSTVTFSQ